jgi:uncharacterized protein (TIGR01777 family)
LKILLTGSHGLIGSSLRRALPADGHEVFALVRAPPRPGAAEVQWDPASKFIDRAGLTGLDGVVHLAGENLAGGRWTAARKQRFRMSRVEATAFLCQTLAELARPPKVLLSASAVGYYGDRGPDWLTEESPPGAGFLARLCRDWEGATAPAAAVGMRVAHLRFGIVLSREGGALAKMLLPFKLGLGGPLGQGSQFWSWIEIRDALAAIRHLLNSSSLAGPVNLVAPQPVTQREFAKALGRSLGRPAFLPVPAWALRLLLGEMADAALLASARVVPARLVAAGFRFRYPELPSALVSALG